MSEASGGGALVVSLKLDDEALAMRVASALAAVPGFRLAAGGEKADLVLSAAAGGPDVEAPFTPRELEVLTQLAEGASNKEIARRLGISIHTAKFHVGQLLDKLDATGRTDAVAQAARLGVIHL